MLAGMATRAAPARPTDRKSLLGAQLRATRMEAGIGLRELARRVGCSPALISQVEHGAVAPSVARLYAIARELGVSVDTLLDGGQARRARRRRHGAASGGRFQLVRAGERHAVDLPGGITWELLAAGEATPVEFRQIEYAPGAASSPPGQLLTHRGQEHGLVLEGELTMQIEDELVALGPGDSIALPANAPHRLSNTGSEPVRAVWIITDHDEPGSVC